MKLVDRLRVGGSFLHLEAVAHIEKLGAALREIADHSPGVTHGWAEHVRHIAHTALSP